MKVLNYLVSVAVGISVFVSCKSSNIDSSTIIDMQVYFSPRNPNYGWSDNGIYHWDLNRASYRVPVESGSYSVKSDADSLYELYYVEFQLPQNELDFCLKGTTDGEEVEVVYPRILVYFSNYPNLDSIVIDGWGYLYIGNKRCPVNQEFMQLLYSKMPGDIRESWNQLEIINISK